MIFSSIEFFVFLALVLAGLSLSRRESLRRNLLLAASYVFYGWWDWRFCFLILVSTLIDYVVGLRLEASTTPQQRKRWLLVSLTGNLGILGVFKYANFFVQSVAPVLQSMGLPPTHLNIILPVGVSFFTFQTMSYSIDVYRGQLKATRNFRDFALFVSFFPQLVAGPIVRGSEFLPQLEYIHPMRRSNLRPGFETFLRGFVKKVLFADTLAFYVDPVFAHPAAFASTTVWMAVIAYAGQIYYDFSGYTEMAIGVGKMMGFELPENFRHPYLSLNVTEFWRRWHMTLSRWLRDYLYVPLGGNRKGRARTYVNLMLTMLLGGLWHGASWTFVAWGGLHGAALAGHKLLLERQGRRAGAKVGGFPRALASWLATFVFVLVTWVFFRAQTFSEAWVILRKMAFLDAGGARWFYVNAMTVLALGSLLHLWVLLRGERDVSLDFRRPLAWPAMAGVVLVLLYFAPFGTSPFIYFQF